MPSKIKIFTEAELIEMDIEALDKMAFGYVQDEEICVEPNKLHIYLSDIENPEALYEKKGMAWVNSVDLSEPIAVSVRGDGRLWLEDGHHRVFCARLRKEKLKAIVEIKANPVLAILNRQKAMRVSDSEPGF